MRLELIARSGRRLASLRPTSIHDRRLPLLVSGLAVGGALPIFPLAGWPLLGWAAGAALWGMAQLAGTFLAFLFGRSLLGSGVVAIGLVSRGVLVAVALLALAASDPSVALAGTVLYAAAYGVELTFTLALYF